MDFEKYTERSRGLVQAAQSLALRAGHQRLTPEHLLKALLDDEEGLAANLIRAAGGDPSRAHAEVEGELHKLP
ncbi:MAG: Clp protease N-terminal domain-containing protein, partial [Kiloniellales bacterium]